MAGEGSAERFARWRSPAASTSATLSTPAMQTPHESLILSEKRGLLAAVMGNASTYPGFVDIYDVNADSVSQLESEGSIGTGSLEDFVSKLSKPRAAWVMVPCGKPTEDTVKELAARFEKDDIIIDGGNSYYRDDIARAEALGARGVRYLDVGTSGGVFGLARGYCLMIGGKTDVVSHLEPIFRALDAFEGDGGGSPRVGRRQCAELPLSCPRKSPPSPVWRHGRVEARPLEEGQESFLKMAHHPGGTLKLVLEVGGHGR